MMSSEYKSLEQLFQEWERDADRQERTTSDVTIPIGKISATLISEIKVRLRRDKGRLNFEVIYSRSDRAKRNILSADIESLPGLLSLLYTAALEAQSAGWLKPKQRDKEGLDNSLNTIANLLALFDLGPRTFHE